MGTPGGNCWGQNLKLLNFDPRRQVRGVFASFFVTDFNRRVKISFFSFLRAAVAVLGISLARALGQNLKLLNFEPRSQVRGVFASFFVADFNPGVKTLILAF